MFRYSLVFLVAATCSVGSVVGKELPSIFNGKDFTGWKVPENNLW